MLQISQWKRPVKQIVLSVFVIIAWTLWFQVQEVQASPNIEVKKVRDVKYFNENIPGAIAYNGKSYIFKDYKSEDGLTWYEYNKSFFDGKNQATYINDEVKTIWDGKRFVMIGDDNEIGTSVDGVTWQTTIIPHKDADKMYVIQDFLYVNGIYYFVAQDRPKEIYIYEDLGGGFYVPGPNAFFTSKDLKSFKLGTKEGMTQSFSGERPINNLMWTGKYFLGNGNGAVTSKDGIHWTGGDSKKMIDFNGSDNLNSVWDGKKFIAATSGFDGNAIISSIDGVKWKTVSKIPNNKIDFKNVGFNGKEYIAVGKGKVFYYSVDGVRWSEVAIDSKDVNIHSVQPTKDGFLIAGSSVYYIKNKDLHTPSNWAAATIQKAVNHQLVSDDLLSYFKSNITRKDFSRASIQLYEALTGVKAVAAKTNPFVDTSDSYILKAYELGMVQGGAQGKFAPNNPVTRQDISIMLYKTLKAAGVQNLEAETSWQSSYGDVKLVAGYAVQALQFFNHNQIINGKENNQLVPRGNTTKEEAIVMLERVFEKFNTRPVVEIEDSIPVSGIAAIQFYMNKKGYSFMLDRISRDNEMYYALRNKNFEKIAVYEQEKKKSLDDIDTEVYIFSEDYPDYFYSDLNIQIDYAPKKDEYKLQLLQEMIERDKGVKLTGLSDVLKNALKNVKIAFGQNSERQFVKINSMDIMYIVFRESESEEYRLEVHYQSLEVQAELEQYEKEQLEKERYEQEQFEKELAEHEEFRDLLSGS